MSLSLQDSLSLSTSEQLELLYCYKQYSISYIHHRFCDLLLNPDRATHELNVTIHLINRAIQTNSFDRRYNFKAWNSFIITVMTFHVTISHTRYYNVKLCVVLAPEMTTKKPYTLFNFLGPKNRASTWVALQVLTNIVVTSCEDGRT